MTGDEFDDLLEGLEGDTRDARLQLLRALRDDGCAMEDIRAAVDEDRLVLLPVERALTGEARFTEQELADRVGIPAEDLRSARRALGLPLPTADGERFYTDADLEVAEGLKAVLDSGIPIARLNELNRVMGRAMAQVAAASRGMVAEELLEPGASEHEVGVLWAAAARELVPRMRPTLAHVYKSHLRELVRSDVISAADIAAGRTAGARDVTVAFADLVGFTRLGEEVPAEELGGVVRHLEELAADVVDQPVTFVKTIGDAVMLVAPEPDPLIATTLRLIEEIGDELQLRAGLACGPALERAGDWFGSPVNLASRVTTVARPQSVLVTEGVRESAERDWAWSYARERKLKGVGEVRLYRVREPSSA